MLLMLKLKQKQQDKDDAGVKRSFDLIVIKIFTIIKKTAKSSTKETVWVR